MRNGASRFLESTPESLMVLAQSSKSDGDMLDEFLRAYNQSEFNQMRHTFEAMPDQIQLAEFNRLAGPTQQILLSGGYEPPNEEKKSLVRRMLTWDIPLLPEEHMGSVIAAGMAPIRMMGFFAGKTASALWEGGVMKPSRFATRLGRSGAYLAEKGLGSFADPRDWRESWNETKIEENSYYSGTVKKAERLVGRHQTRLLRAYLEGGQQAAYDLILKEGQKNGLTEERAGIYWRNWQSTLSEESNVKALEILESGKLSLFDASQRAFNTVSPWDVNPDSWQGKSVGMVGALATEILLDPTTWGGGALFKIVKHAKVGMRAGMTADAIHFSERLSKALRAEAKDTGLFAPIRIWNPTTGQFDDALSEVKEWVAKGGVGSSGSLTQGNIPIGRGRRLIRSGAQYLAQTNPMLRAQHRSINRLIDRVNAAFKKQDEIDEFSRAFRAANPDENVHKAVMEEFGTDTGLGQLMRDVPAMAPIIGDMWNWHLMRRRMSLTVDARHIDGNGMWRVHDSEGKLLGEARVKGDPSNPMLEDDAVFTNEGVRIVKHNGESVDFQTRTFPTLATEQGFWDFLKSQTGWEMRASKVGAVDPDAIFIPRMSKFGEKWADGKNYVRTQILSFDNLETEVVADLARGAAKWLVDQGEYIHVGLRRRIDEGALELSNDIDDLGLQSVLDDPSISNARRHGLGEADIAKIEEARLELEPEAIRHILDNGEMDPLLMFHQGKGIEIIDGVPVQDVWEIPFAGVRRARKNYWEGQIHKAGGANAELDWWVRTGMIAKTAVATLGYYPARFAEKLVTYVPKAAHIDVSDTKLALAEFQGLVDMGIMVDMPRTQIDNYLRAYTMGTDAEKWLVTTEFYLDFLGRSGVLMHGGSDVQRFVERFIRQGAHRYGNIVDDMVGLPALGGLHVRKAIMPGEAYAAQLARANVIPNYRELGAVAKYMSFYRRLGWGLHLPAVDSLLARTWRPAVLLRMGYVVRNGGEELFTWMMREGPSHYGKQKLAKVAADFHPSWDAYGRKTLVKGSKLPDEERLPLLWKPISGIWRSFNEIAGVGDYAIFRKSLLEVVEKNKDRWAALLEDSPELAFKLFEDTHEAVKLRTGRTVLGKTSKRLFEFSNAKANELSLVARDAFGRMPGMPTRQGIANRVLTKVAKNHEERVAAVAASLTIPTLLDAQMRDILGTFDNYLNYSKNTMDDALRQGTNVTSVDRLLKMTVDYQNTELAWVSNEPGSEMGLVRKSQAVAQRLAMHSDDIFARAYLNEIINYVTPRIRQELTATAEGLSLAALTGGSPDEVRRMRALLADKSPEQIVLLLAQDQPDALDTLRLAFDRVGPGAYFDEAGDLVVTDMPFEAGWPDAVDDFIEAMPEAQRDLWRNLLDPEVGGQKVGADVNIVAFLLGQSDAARLTDDWDEVVRRGRLAYVNRVMTPDGQDILRTVHRSNAGFAALGGKASEILPPGATRLFVPMIPVEYRETLVEMLAEGRAGEGWFGEVVDLLTAKFKDIGYGEVEALKAARMLQPSYGPGSTGLTASSLVANANLWQEVGEGFFPVVVGSANPKVAHIISQVLEEVLAARVPTRYRYVGRGHRIGSGRIHTMDVNSEELWNAPGLAAANRPAELDVTVVRNAVGSRTAHQDMATALGGEYMNSYYGWGREGATTARDFGPRGLRDEPVIGIAAQHLISPRPGGLSPVAMLDGEPVTHMTRYYRHPTSGEFVVLRHGREPSDDWFLDYELVEEQITTGNDLQDMAEELAYLNSFELNDLISTGSRQDYTEVFHPWLREVLMPHEVSTVRVAAYASRARWWPNAPENILAFMPVTEEGGKVGEKISKAWTSILRNWFDGVVNPMIGAMVREPLFQHYLTIGKEQTVGVRRLYHRPKIERRAPGGKGVWEEVPYNYRLYDSLGIGYIDGDAQYVIDELEGFIEFDWPLAKADPEAAASQLASAIEVRSPFATIEAIDKIIAGGDAPADVTNALKRVKRIMQDSTSANPTVVAARERLQNEFFGWALHRKVMADSHRDIAARRAMTLTSAFIDDHRIRSQFQQMVGTVVPFWFAEDNFLRRIGRSLQHNPLVFRNLHLTMNAGVYSGIVQEDQFGEKKIVIPGSEVGVHAMLSIADKTPIVNSVFGGDLGSVQRPGMGLAMNIHVIPGYDLDSIGQLGLGPLLAAPINFASGRDAEIRKTFEHNLVGGRYPGASKLSTGAGGTISNVFEAAWSSVAPALVVRAISLAGIDGPNGEARAKAKVDVLKFLAMHGSIPDEQEIASHSNPALYEEWFLEDVDQMARQYQLLQAMSWFFGPATGNLADLTLHENWEWNQEFHELLEMGIPYEEAYPQWVKNVEARTGEKFDPIEHSPFRTSGQSKIPFAVLETTQDANKWLVDNDAFARDFTMSSAFFMPRKFDVEDDEYVAEAKQRQLNMGLRKMDTPEEFLSELYFNISYPVYHKRRVTYMTRRNAMRSMNMDTTELDEKWDLWYASFQMQHPVFVNQITTGTARIKRDSTVNEFRLLIESPELVPEGLHRTDILNAMATIVGFSDKMDSLKGQSDPMARAKRDALRYQYSRIMEEFVHNKPWLNELYYSVFLPIIGESWIAKHKAGLVSIDMGVI